MRHAFVAVLVATLSASCNDTGVDEYQSFQSDYAELVCPSIEECGEVCVVEWDIEASFMGCDESDFIPEGVEECLELVAESLSGFSCENAEAYMTEPPCKGIVWSAPCGFPE